MASPLEAVINAWVQAPSTQARAIREIVLTAARVGARITTRDARAIASLPVRILEEGCGEGTSAALLEGAFLRARKALREEKQSTLKKEHDKENAEDRGRNYAIFGPPDAPVIVKYTGASLQIEVGGKKVHFDLKAMTIADNGD